MMVGPLEPLISLKVVSLSGDDSGVFYISGDATLNISVVFNGGTKRLRGTVTGNIDMSGRFDDTEYYTAN